MKTLHTIGYESTNIDAFVAALRLAGITVLADVRAVALSRKPGFSKTKLRERLELEGIRYEHLVDLGDPKPGREAAREGRMNAFRTIYDSHLRTELAQQALEYLADLARNESVCLLCFERDPSTCHRSIVASAMRKATGIEISNLFGESGARGAKSSAEGPRRHPGESAAAA